MHLYDRQLQIKLLRNLLSTEQMRMPHSNAVSCPRPSLSSSPVVAASADLDAVQTMEVTIRMVANINSVGDDPS